MLFTKIKDIIIKTFISVEAEMNATFQMYVPHRNNCFQLFGFDIMIDDKLNPWLLEVNLSPSLSCDSPLDQKIKSRLMADLLNLAGLYNFEYLKRLPGIQVENHNPTVQQLKNERTKFKSSNPKTPDKSLENPVRDNRSDVASVASSAKGLSRSLVAQARDSINNPALLQKLSTKPSKDIDYESYGLYVSTNLEQDSKDDRTSEMPLLSTGDNVQVQSPVNPVIEAGKPALKTKKGHKHKVGASKPYKDRSVYCGGTQATHNLNLSQARPEKEYGCATSTVMQNLLISQNLSTRQVEQILRESEAEFRRRGSFNLIFPSFQFSISLYKNMFNGIDAYQATSGLVAASDSYHLNQLLHQRFLKKDIYNQ